MTTTRTSTYRRRSLRGAALALFTGAGIALTPVSASADAGAAPVAAAPAAVTVAPVAAPNSAAQVAVDTALAQQGKPYVWGGTGPGLRLLGAHVLGISGGRRSHPAHLAGAVDGGRSRRHGEPAAR